MSISKIASEVDLYIGRIRELLMKMKHGTDILPDDVINLVDRLESTLFRYVLTMCEKGTANIRSAQVFQIFESRERKLNDSIIALKEAIMENNIYEAFRILNRLKTEITSYLKLLAIAFRVRETGVGVGVEEEIAGVVKIPESLSPIAGKIYAYLKRHGEADVIQLISDLGLTRDEINKALNELRKLNYIDLYVDRTGSTVVRLREIW